MLSLETKLGRLRKLRRRLDLKIAELEKVIRLKDRGEPEPGMIWCTCCDGTGCIGERDTCMVCDGYGEIDPSIINL